MKRPQLEILIEEKFLELGEVRLHSFELDVQNRTCFCELLVTNCDSSSVVCGNDSCYTQFIKDLVDVDVTLKLIKNHLDMDFLERKLITFFKKNSILSKGNNGERFYELSSKIGEDGRDVAIITLKGNLGFCSYMRAGYQEDLQRYLHRSFTNAVEIIISQTDEEIAIEMPRIEDLRRLSICNTEKFLGTPSGALPFFISDIDKPYALIVVCGKVSDFKKMKKKDPKPNKKGVVNEYYFTFKVADPSGEISCLYFSSVSNNGKVAKIEDREVVIAGEVDYSRDGDLRMVVKSIAFCQILTKEPPPSINLRSEPMYYQNVFPEDVIIYEQDNMLEQRTQYDLSKFEGKSIVIFDLETTGLSSSKDRIIEIGAVKIVDGVFTEKFSVLINPEMHIPEGASAVNHIYDKDVADSLKLEDVMGDFFKFSYGSILCGHNVKGFDMKFLKEAGVRYKYEFENEVIDTLELSRQYVKNARGHKLSDLCLRYSIVNENAHRAYEDSIATGQVLIAMLNEYKEIEI